MHLIPLPKNLCNAPPSPPSWYSSHHYPTQFILPYSFLILPFLTLMSLKRKKPNWNKAKQPLKERGRVSEAAKELQIQQFSLHDPYSTLQHQYPRILDLITSKERIWGQWLTSFYWLGLLISWCGFLNVFKSCCILWVGTKRIHVKTSTNSRRHSHTTQSEIFYCDTVPKAFSRTSRPNQEGSKLCKQNDHFYKSS